MNRINSYAVPIFFVFGAFVSTLPTFGQNKVNRANTDIITLNSGASFDFSSFRDSSEVLGLGFLIIQEIKEIKEIEKNRDNRSELINKYHDELGKPIGKSAHSQMVLYKSDYGKKKDPKDPYLMEIGEGTSSIKLTDDFYIYVYCDDSLELEYLEQNLRVLGEQSYKIAPNSYAVGSLKGSCKVQGEEGRTKLYSAMVKLAKQHAQNLAGENWITNEEQSRQIDSLERIVASQNRLFSNRFNEIEEKIKRNNELKVQFNFGGIRSMPEDYFKSLEELEGDVNFKSAELSVHYFRNLDTTDSGVQPLLGMGVGLLRNNLRIDLQSAAYKYKGTDMYGQFCNKTIRFVDHKESYQAKAMFIELNGGIKIRDESDKHEFYFLTGLRFNVTEPIRAYASSGEFSISGIYDSRPPNLEIEDVPELGFISNQNTLNQQNVLDTRAFSLALNTELGYSYLISKDFKLNLGFGLNLQNDFVDEQSSDFISNWENSRFNSFSNLRESRNIVFFDFSFGFSILM